MPELRELLGRWVDVGWWRYLKKPPLPLPTCEVCPSHAVFVKRHAPELPDALSRFCREHLNALDDLYIENERRRAGQDTGAIRRKADRLGIPILYVEMLAEEKLDDWPSLIAAHDFLGAQQMTMLILAGEHGAGKSMAGCWILWEANRGMFMTGATFAATSIYDLKAWGPMLRAPLLVVDDVHSEFFDGKSIAARKLEALLCDRDANRRKTVITTNARDPMLTLRLADRFQKTGRLVLLRGEHA